METRRNALSVRGYIHHGHHLEYWSIFCNTNGGHVIYQFGQEVGQKLIGEDA